MPAKVVDIASWMVRFFVLHQNAHQFSLKTSRKKSDLSLDWVNKLSYLEIEFPGKNGHGRRGRRFEKALSVPSLGLPWEEVPTRVPSCKSSWDGCTFFFSDQTCEGARLLSACSDLVVSHDPVCLLALLFLRARHEPVFQGLSFSLGPELSSSCPGTLVIIRYELNNDNDTAYQALG